MRSVCLGVFATLTIAFYSFTPVVMQAAGLVPCGGPGEPACQTCHVIELVNGTVSWLVVFLGTVAAIIIVYAGFKLVTSGGNGHAMGEAKSMINNMIIGYVIVLAGWLLVDTGMKMLLTDGETALGVWNQVACTTQPEVNDPGEWDPNTDPNYIPTVEESTCDGQSGSYSCRRGVESCELRGGTAEVNQATGQIVCTFPPSGGNYDPDGLGQCRAENTACSVSALQSAGLSSQQANIMSCIAMTESSGIPSTPPYNVTHPGSNSSACGTFQITQTTWNGHAPSGSCRDWRSNCQNAACNAQVMVNLVRANGYRDWTCPNCNNKAATCVRKYGG